MVFQNFDVDQVQLIMKRVILKSKKHIKGYKKVSAIHIVVPEDNKYQVIQSLKEIHPSIPRQNCLEGVLWRAIENISNRDFTVTKQSAIVAERMKFKKNASLLEICTTKYRHLQNVNVKIETEPYLPLLQFLMSLKFYKDLTKGLFVTIRQQYDDEPVTFSYMVEVSQDIAAILPTLPLLLEGRLVM